MPEPLVSPQTIVHRQGIAQINVGDPPLSTSAEPISLVLLPVPEVGVLVPKRSEFIARLTVMFTGRMSHTSPHPRPGLALSVSAR
jgi:hypothetical protein